MGFLSSVVHHPGAAVGGALSGTMGAGIGAAYDYLNKGSGTQAQKAPPLGPLFMGDAAAQQQRNTATDKWRQQYLGDINQWQQGRQGYAQALSDQFVGAANPAAQTENRDLSRRNTFAQARRGTQHGSSDFDAQGQLQAGYAQRLAQIMAQGRGIQRGQETQDADTAQAWRAQAFGVAPGEQLATQSQLDASRARQGQAGQMGTLQQQGIADNQGYQQFLSQLMGGQLSTAGKVVNTAGQLGYGPQWAQALGQQMSGGYQ